MRAPAGIAPETLDDATYMPPAMPWIDPKKEAEAWGMLEDRAYASGPEIIRKRGGNPIDVLEQQARWLREKDANGVPHNAGMPDTDPADDEPDALVAAQVAALQREPKDTSDIDRQRLALTERIVNTLAAGDAQ